MSLEEYRDILKQELSNGNEESSNIIILKAKQELLKNEEQRKENFEILSSLDGYSLRDQINMLNNYINQNNSGMSEDKSISYTYSNPNVPKIFKDDRDGFTNIVLLSISLIILVIIIIAVIFI